MKKIIRLCGLFILLLLFPLVVNAKDNKVTLYLFHGDGCPHCASEIEYLKNKFKITVNGHDVIPTHIRIRNGKVPTFWHVFTPIEITESNLLTNGILYNQSNESEMTYIDNKTPLIVEFINKSVDENNIVSINVTGLALFFVDSTNN